MPSIGIVLRKSLYAAMGVAAAGALVAAASWAASKLPRSS